MTKWEIIQPEPLDEYLGKLNLKWPIKWLLDDVQDEIVRISSSESRKEHEIILGHSAFDEFDLCIGDFVNALCKCQLAEKMGKVFCLKHFPVRNWEKGPAQSSGNFPMKVVVMILASAQIDTWANDLRQKHWPELSTRDLMSFAFSIGGVCMYNAQILTYVSAQLAIALYEAARIRIKNDYLPELSINLQGAGVTMQPWVEPVVKFFAELPELTLDPEEGRKLLEEGTQKLMKMLSLPYAPVFKQEDGKWVWDIGEQG